MPKNQGVIIYSFGFEFDGVLYCWKNKELYRMPYTKNNRSYQKRKLNLQKIGGSYGYFICGVAKSLFNLESITKKIEYKETFTIASDCPF
jgi:hypothetical protein